MNGSQRILQVFNRYEHVGGEEIMVNRIGELLGRRNEVENFFSSTRELLQGSMLRKVQAPLKTFHNAAAARDLTRRQTTGKFDVWMVHNVFPALSPSVYQAAFRLGVPVIQYLHNYRFSCVNGFFLNHGELCTRCLKGNFLPAFTTACWRDSRLAGGVMGLTLRRIRSLHVFGRVREWVAISNFQRERHIEMGIPGDRITTIPHFIQTPATTPPAPPADGHVLFVGRLSPEKGVTVLLEAWRLIAHPGRTLVIAGSGPDEARLRERAAALNLRDVRFTGFVQGEGLERLRQEACVIVVPSTWYETFGMVVLEAWASGRPVLAADIGGLAELVQQNVNGQTFRAADAGDLAEKLNALLSAPARLAEMGEAGYNHARRELSPERWLDRFAVVLQKAVKRAPSSGPIEASKTQPSP